MAKEKIIIGEDNQIKELKGEELEAFIADREAINKSIKAWENKLAEQKELKISAYKKLGLTDEEIAAII